MQICDTRQMIKQNKLRKLGIRTESMTFWGPARIDVAQIVNKMIRHTTKQAHVSHISGSNLVVTAMLKKLRVFPRKSVMSESQQNEQLLDDEVIEMQHQLLDEGIDNIPTATTAANPYHKLPSLDSIRM